MCIVCWSRIKNAEKAYLFKMLNQKVDKTLLNLPNKLSVVFKLHILTNTTYQFCCLTCTYHQYVHYLQGQKTVHVIYPSVITISFKCTFAYSSQTGLTSLHVTNQKINWPICEQNIKQKSLQLKVSKSKAYLSL